MREKVIRALPAALLALNILVTLYGAGVYIWYMHQRSGPWMTP